MTENYVEGLGPITQRLKILAPESGGFVLALGHNECGKSTVLDAISESVHQTNGLEKSRSVARGAAEFFGMKLTVGQNTRRSGELAVLEFEGLNLAEAIDTGIADPIRAGRRRAMILCNLLGVKLNMQAFADIVGGSESLKRVASERTMAATSVPEAAELLKRDLDALAHAAKEEAGKHNVVAAGLRVGIGDVDLTKPADEQKLASATEAAVRDLAELEGRAKQARETEAKMGSARATLDALRAKPAEDESEAQAQLDSARAAESTATEALGAATQAVTAAEEAKAEAIRQADLAIAAAKQRQNEAQSAAGAAMLATRQAQARLDGLAKRRADLAAAELAVAQSGGSIVEAPSEEAIAAARAAVELARKAQENGAIVRRLREQKLRADEEARIASEFEARSNELRGWAASVHQVVASALAPCLPENTSLDEDGRMLVKQNGQVFFFEQLSEGAQAEIIIRAAARAGHRISEEESKRTGQPAKLPVFVFDQRYGEALDPMRILKLHELARQERCLIYSARNDAGELRILEAPEALASMVMVPKPEAAA